MCEEGRVLSALRFPEIQNYILGLFDVKIQIVVGAPFCEMLNLLSVGCFAVVWYQPGGIISKLDNGICRMNGGTVIGEEGVEEGAENTPLLCASVQDECGRCEIFPSAFKQAGITSLLKKPTLNPTLLGNYRPVSLLPFIAKTLERVVFNQVPAFLTQNNLLDSNQSGFRSGHSTETALLSVVEALRLARVASKSSLLILLDLSAAFDTVNHQILLSTLLRKGISGTALQWFES